MKPSGKEYRLVTLMALREAGERHHDLIGVILMFRQGQGWQSKETKARHNKKVSYEEAKESYAKYHPAFVEGW